MNDLNFNYFQSQLPELLKEHKGEFVIIKDQSIKGYFSSFEDAMKEANNKFATEDFLIQEITDEKRVNYINSAFLTSAFA